MEHRFDHDLTRVQTQLLAKDSSAEPAETGPEHVANTAVADQAVQARAQRGTQGASTTLPHADRIQASFGGHDVSGIKAYVGGEAAAATNAMGADAYATGNRVAFASAPNLHTASHEAAHVVQQRSGVQLLGGVGKAGDRYEQNADAAADAVVAGRSAEAVLSSMAGPNAGAAASDAVQRKLWATKKFKRESSMRFARRASDKKLRTIDRSLDRVHRANTDDKTGSLNALLAAINAWMTEKERTQIDATTHAGKAGHKKGNIRTKAVLELKDMVLADLGQSTTDAGPKTVADTTVPSELANEAPTGGVVTLAVHGSEDHLYKKMFKFIRGKGRMPKVGHSWVRIKAKVGDREQANYTFGFWPASGWPKGLDESVPGKILNPDHEHEAKVTSELTTGNRLYRDYPVDAAQLQNALGRAQRLVRVAPAYNATRYNCTSFASDVVTAAGGSFPNAGLFMAPGALFDSLAKQENSDDNVHRARKVTVDCNYMVYPNPEESVALYDRPEGSVVETLEPSQLSHLKVLDPAFPNMAPTGYVTVRSMNPGGTKNNVYVKASVLLDNKVAGDAARGEDWVRSTIIDRAPIVDELTVRPGFSVDLRSMGASTVTKRTFDEPTTLHVFSMKQNKDDMFGQDSGSSLVRIAGVDGTMFIEQGQLGYARRFGGVGKERAKGRMYKVSSDYGIQLAKTRSDEALNDPDVRLEKQPIVLELNDPQYDDGSELDYTDLVRVRVLGETEFCYTSGGYLSDGEQGVFNAKGKKAPPLPERSKRPVRNSKGKQAPPLPKRTSRLTRVSETKKAQAKPPLKTPPPPVKKVPPLLPLRPLESAKHRIELGAHGVGHLHGLVTSSQQSWDALHPSRGLFGKLFGGFRSKSSSSEVDGIPMPRGMQDTNVVDAPVSHDYTAITRDGDGDDKGTLLKLKDDLSGQADKINTATAHSLAKPVAATELQGAKAKVDVATEAMRGKVETRHVSQLQDIGVGIVQGIDAMLKQALGRGGISYESLKIGSKLGKGGSGATVFNAKYMNMAQMAYKVFDARDELATEGQVGEDYEARREARIMSEFSHPNILKSGGNTDRAEAQPGYVMEKAAFGSLKDVFGNMASWQLTTRQRLTVTRYLIKGAFSALAALHGQGYVHGDIKDDNFLLGGDKQVKMMDFGLSHKSHAQQGFKGHAHAGTGPYMAPEVVQNQIPEKESDIWSLGETLLYGVFDWDSVDFLGNAKNKTSANKENLRPGMSDSDWQGNFSAKVTAELPAGELRTSFEAFVKAAMVKEPSSRLTAQQALDHPFLKDMDSSAETAALGLLDRVSVKNPNA